MKKKMAFKPVSVQTDFIKLEKEILAWWYESGLVEKYLKKNQNAKKNFSFLDGPITANNPMGVHHGWGRTLKDLFQRYKNMQGYRERFQSGFDNQGLWVEVEVEKELGFKSKKDIEKYGIEKFVQKCKERTLKFADIQTQQSKRLGYFMDWDHSYYTMSDENNYMIWFFLKKCWHEKNLYKGKDSVPWCPRCGTAISQHEILTEEYKQITHESIFLKLPIKNRPNEHFLVWTTTPWTIPANVALAVNPEFTYGAYQEEPKGEILVLLTDLARKVLGQGWKEIKKFTGQELEGLVYDGPFDGLPAALAAKAKNPKTFHTVVLSSDLVTAQEGTGIVHIAPGAGQEDFKLGKEKDLSIIAAIDEEANYLSDFGVLSGKNAKNEPHLIIDSLKQKEDGRFLFKVEAYTHRYPICWRCKTELVWRVVEEWYIAMDPLRERMKEVTKSISWIPGWGLNQELDWLSHMDDWLISKKRYWGLALPIWECSKCGHFEVIGSKEELKQKAIKGWDKFAPPSGGHSPHRPWIDEVKIKCQKCGAVVSRIPDVGNPWLDAGIVPFSTFIDPKTKKVSYLDDKNYWREWFPADFVTECFPGQFRNWFYSLIAMSSVLEDKPPFKTLLGHALVKDEKGEEMHKSKGNAIEFNEAADKMGVDIMRYLYLSQSPAHNLNFGFGIADQMRRRFLLTFWNVYNFFITYANIDGWQPTKEGLPKKTVLDNWILTRLDEVILEVTTSLDKYEYYLATASIEKFVQDLSLWFVRRSRQRIGPTAKNSQDKDSAYTTLYTVLETLTRILAPFMPFFTEEVYQNLVNGGKFQVDTSVHLSAWPQGKSEKELNHNLLLKMEKVRQIVELGHSARKETKIKVRQPLSSLTVVGEEEETFSSDFVDLIKEELNVKKVIFTKGKKLTVSLETKITDELREEGEARELVREIQELRKKEGCLLDEEIIILSPSWPKRFEEKIKKETLAKKIEKGKTLAIETCQK